MNEKPFMPKATAVWLVENTKISFKQIADFCHLHELEVKGIADGDVAKGIKAYNPILAGQLTREEIEACSIDNSKPIILNKLVFPDPFGPIMDKILFDLIVKFIFLRMFFASFFLFIFINSISISFFSLEYL